MTLPPSGPRPVDPRVLHGRGPQGTDPAAPDSAEAVDGATAALAGLADRPLAEHVAVFERIHVALGDALAAGAVAGEASGRA
jgi:hypothetical protein